MREYPLCEWYEDGRAFCPNCTASCDVGRDDVIVICPSCGLAYYVPPVHVLKQVTRPP